MRLAALLLLCAWPSLAQVRFTPQADRIDVEISGKAFTTFYWGGDAPKPYLHPLRTASGLIVTRAYPMESVPGETRDHPHHRGLWFTHGDVNGFDFWMNEKGQSPKVGLISPKGKPSTSGSAIRGTFEWKSPTGDLLLTEDRKMIFAAQGDMRLIDFDVTFTAADNVKFGDTKEGFFAIRLADKLTEKSGGGKMTNAEGASGMKEVWGKRSPWVDYAGELNGEKLGIAILDHPGNPKHPTYWHARDYGLFAANPFGEHDYYNDKSRDGGIALKPKDKLRFRYRVVIHPAGADLPALYRTYTGS